MVCISMATSIMALKPDETLAEFGVNDKVGICHRKNQACSVMGVRTEPGAEAVGHGYSITCFI